MNGSHNDISGSARRFPPLNLPDAHLRTQFQDGIAKVFDPLRKKYVALTPEEYVRQSFTSWLMQSRHFPASLMANEVGMSINGLRLRCDTLVYGRDGKPMMIVEYKAPDVAISQAVFDQIVHYNMLLHADYLVVTNGLNHYCARMDYAAHTYHFIPGIPDFDRMSLPFSDN